MQPDVLYLILCDDVQTDPNNYHRLNVFGLVASVQSTAHPPFPVVRPLLCALVILTGGKGTDELILQVFHERTGRVVFRSSPRQVRFVGDPEAVLGVVFRIRDCCFPAAGLYWVQLAYGGLVIARQKLCLKT